LTHPDDVRCRTVVDIKQNEICAQPLCLASRINCSEVNCKGKGSGFIHIHVAPFCEHLTFKALIYGHLPANHTIPRKRSPDGVTTDWCGRYLIAASAQCTCSRKL